MRDFIIIGVIAVCAIVIGTALYYFGPSSYHGDAQSVFAGDASTTTVPFTMLAKGSNALSVQDRVNYQISSSDEFLQVWSLVYGDKNGGPKVPQVDFSKYDVLAIFDGTHETNGYGVEVRSIGDSNGVRNVAIEHTSPGQGCTTAAAQVSPFVIVEVPKSTYKLSHEDIEDASSCH